MKDVLDGGVGNRRTITFHDCGQDIIQLATNYASDYLDYVENLPFDLQRNVTKLREVDQKCREYVKEMEQLYENFVKDNDGSQGVPRRSYLLQIRRLFGLCKELGDEKISIVQSISEAIESRNKQLEHGCRRFRFAYEPSIKMDHNKKDKDLKSDSARGNKRSRRQRNNNSSENKEKNLYGKEQEKSSKVIAYDDADEPPPKVMLSSSSPDHSSPAASSAPALTRAALREEDKRAANRLKDKKDEKLEKDADNNSTVSNSGKNANDPPTTVQSSPATSASATSSVPTSKAKSGSTSAVSSSTTASKANNKGKKKKRKSNKHQTEKQTGNSGEVSPIIDTLIDPDEPTYCICQQVSFGQMIGCDNLKCPIEWFHFSCVRLTHKPKGKWYCPDCTIKRKREGKRGADNR